MLFYDFIVNSGTKTKFKKRSFTLCRLFCNLVYLERLNRRLNEIIVIGGTCRTETEKGAVAV